MTGLGVRTENLTVRFSGVPALDGLDLRLAPDKIHGLLGRNGSGKSTLAGTLAGFRKPDDGRVLLDGGDLGDGREPYEDAVVTSRVCLIRESGDLVDSAQVKQVLQLAAALRPYWSEELRLRRVLQTMVIGVRPIIVGYWLVMLVTFLLGGLIAQFFGSGINHSMWDYGTQSPKYFSAAIGITVTPALFALMVSHGITRRMFAVAAGIFLVGAAVSTALIWMLAYQVEHVIYDWAGLTQTLDNPHLFTSTSQVGLIFTEFFLLVVAHEAAGWMIGIGFFRFGFWKGLALLPLGVLPAAAAEFLLVAQWMADALRNTGYHRPPLAVGVPGVLAVSALGLYFGYLMLRSMGLKPAKG